MPSAMLRNELRVGSAAGIARSPLEELAFQERDIDGLHEIVVAACRARLHAIGLLAVAAPREDASSPRRGSVCSRAATVTDVLAFVPTGFE